MILVIYLLLPSIKRSKCKPLNCLQDNFCLKLNKMQEKYPFIKFVSVIKYVAARNLQKKALKINLMFKSTK